MAHSAHQRHLPRLGAAALGVLALTLAGCSTPADSAPTPPPTTANPTTTAPPQATPTTTAAAEPSTPARSSVNPKIPAEATWDVVDRFFAAYADGLHTGDTSLLRELSTEDCKSCANLIERIDTNKKKNIVGTGGSFRFPFSEELVSSHEGRFVWRAEYTQVPITYEYPNTEDSHTTEPLSSVAYIELVRVGPDWRINGITASMESER